MITSFISIDPQYTISEEIIQRIVSDKLQHEEVENAEVSVSIVDKHQMDEVCKQYMDDGLEHDVLSFPLEEGSGEFVEPDEVRRLGDIIVSYSAAEEQAQEKNISIDKSIQFLIEHALMHLLGHHHDDGIVG